MKRLLLILTLAAAPAWSATVISPLPNNIQNGQPADASKLMANFNQIVTNVNANAAAINATNVFTAPQQFSGATTLNQGVIASQAQNDTFVWLGLATGTANALTASAQIAPIAYQAGQRWTVQAALANTGAVTINISGLGVRSVTKFGGTALVAGDIVANQILVLEDDGVRLQIVNPTIPSGIPYVDAGGTPNAITATYILPAKNLTLVDGLDLSVGIPVANTGTPVTFTPTINGITYTAWNVVKFVGNVETPVAVGDIQGDAWLKADVPNTVWVLMNPATLNTAQITQVQQSGNPPGTIIDFAGTSCPTGYLIAPTIQTNISRTTYAALFTAIGTTWGTGDGSTTFGMPWFPANYATVQASANVGTSTLGQMPAHTHAQNVSTDGAVTSAYLVSNSVAGNTVQGFYNPVGIGVTGTGLVTLNTASAGSGTANLAAAVRILKCVKY